LSGGYGPPEELLLSDDPVFDALIVGAGAAGLTTAIFARRSGATGSIALLEGARTPGAKILVSGGSRCNVTNATVTERDFWGGRPTIVRRILRAFPADDTVAFFRELGVTLHEEASGKLFPDTNRARDVLNALLNAATAAGVTILAGHRVLGITAMSDGFQVATSQGPMRARAVVLATGGRSLPKSGSDGAGYAIARQLGHTIVETTPALDALVLNDHEPLHRQLSGVSLPAQLAVWIDGTIAIRLSGSLLLTHIGVSGPLAMNASRHFLRARLERRDASVTASFCPGLQLDDVDAAFLRAAALSPRNSLQTWVATLVPASMSMAIVAHLHLDGTIALAQLPREDRRRLAAALVGWPLHVVGSRGYTYAEATAGGVALDEIDPATMASRVCPGLYLVGEILDVDGRIGGFNFQWAWSTGCVAGRALGPGGRGYTKG